MARPITVPGSRFPYARKVVPADVRHIIGRTEFKRPLRGATEAERHRQHGEALAEWTGEIEAARGTLRGEFVHLSRRRVLALCGEWYAAELAAC